MHDKHSSCSSTVDSNDRPHLEQVFFFGRHIVIPPRLFYQGRKHRQTCPGSPARALLAFIGFFFAGVAVDPSDCSRAQPFGSGISSTTLFQISARFSLSAIQRQSTKSISGSEE